MNKKLSRLLRVIASVLIVSIVISGVGFVVNHPTYGIDQTISPFYDEEKDALDYVVIGSSASWVGISPIEIYKTSGLKGYNLSLNAVSANIYSSILKEIANRQKHAIVIVDIDGFLSGDEGFEEREPKSYWIDTMKKNKNWFNSIRELDKENQIEHYFPIIRYHKGVLSTGTIKNYIDPQYYNLYKDLKGFFNYPDDYSRFIDSAYEDATIMNNKTSESMKLSETGLEVFEDFISECQDLNIQNVLFVRMPRAFVTKSDYNDFVNTSKKCNYIKDVVNKYGYTVLDYQQLNNPANVIPSDFIDTGHMHIEGAKKYSKYLAEYLNSNYEFDNPTPDNNWDALVSTIDEKYSAIRSMPAEKFE